MSDVVIVSAVRTAIGSFNGALASLAAHELGAIVIRAALERAAVAPQEVDEVVFGQVLVAGHGQNPVRRAALAAGLPVASTAFGLSQVCGSGLRSVLIGAQIIAAGDADILVVGGQESMSQARHAIHLRSGVKMGPAQLVDTMVVDGLWDAFADYHMGQTAENIAEQWGLSRAELDAFAVASQQRAAVARTAGRFDDEIVPVKVAGRRGDVIVAEDEYIKPETTPEGLAKLKPAFSKTGKVTAGNASGLNDGAAALVLMTAAAAQKRGLIPLARIAGGAVAGVDPSIMGIGPVPASRKALGRAGWSIADLDLIEANEAFAAQAIAVVHDLDLDPARVNVNGGAIALGHPVGASGARILVTLLHELRRRDGRKGLATLCVGGGMGVSLCVER
ncbi:acetyl-CoA C-acetyltransferase [Rhodopseudomonas palustris]|uniref:Beta-ketothiolase n=1 Tax=Rhodopseudomonas palustris (strain BisB18) TaxID=316056 RepID=Q21BM2_RHOPB